MKINDQVLCHKQGWATFEFLKDKSLPHYPHGKIVTITEIVDGVYFKVLYDGEPWPYAIPFYCLTKELGFYTR